MTDVLARFYDLAQGKPLEWCIDALAALNEAGRDAQLRFIGTPENADAVAFVNALVAEKRGRRLNTGGIKPGGSNWGGPDPAVYMADRIIRPSVCPQSALPCPALPCPALPCPALVRA